MAVVDLAALEITLNYLDLDAATLSAIANDSPTNPNPGEANGTVTTRQGTVVNNVQKVIADLEAAVATFTVASFTSASLTGVDTKLVTGTNGSSGEILMWNVDGDAVGSSEINISGSNIKIGTNPDYLGKFTVSNGTSSALISSLGNELVIEDDTNVGITLATTSAHTGSIEFSNEINSAVGAIRYDNASNVLTIDVNSAEAIRITADGAIGMGILSPAAPLHVNTNINDVGMIIQSTTSGSQLQMIDSIGSIAIGNNNGEFFLQTGGDGGAGTGLNTALVVDTSQSMIINATAVAGTEKLRVNGGVYIDQDLYVGGVLTIPSSATPTVDADGEMSIDTAVTNWSHSLLKIYGTEELAVLTVPIAEVAAPTDGYVIAYNAINEELEFAPQNNTTVNAQTGSTYTLALADANNTIMMDNTAANALRIPANASVAFLTGVIMHVGQKGAGITTIVSDAGVTINGVTSGLIALSGQWKMASLLKIGTDEWFVSGDVGSAVAPDGYSAGFSSGFE